uniref:Plastocyanin-like domain-containing protein n=1 Tax=Amphimedon queenslandica TaxID=400682 RepID=A0A1X7UMW5_AMPQE
MHKPFAKITYSSDGAEVGPVPYWSGIINGKGRHASVPYVNSELSVFEVSPGSVYRFRLIGAQSLYAYRFSIDRHKLTVIATDGQYIRPVEVDFILIHSGERYDFLLQTENNTSQFNYLIRAVTLEVNDEENKNITEAILHYNTDSSTYPTATEYESIARSSQSDHVRCTEASNCTALNCPFLVYPQSHHISCEHIHNLRLLFPVSDSDLPTNGAKGRTSLFFNFGFEGISQTSAINARNLKLPSSPPALYETPENLYEETCKNLDTDWQCNQIASIPDSNCYCSHVVNVSSDHTIQLVISATGPNTTQLGNFLFAHPVHLHGHYFQVADIQFGRTDSMTGRLEEGSSDVQCGGDLLCTNPSWSTNTYDSFDLDSSAPLKDTLLIPAGGYAVVYFKSDNPGWWFLHCHIEVHQLEGMGLIINEGGKKTPAPYTMQKCGNFDFTVDEYKKAIEGKLNPSDVDGYKIATIVLGSVLGTILVIVLLVLFILFCIRCIHYIKKHRAEFFQT